MKSVHEILVEPHITERTTKNMVNAKTGDYTYVFKVAKDANKIEIGHAVEKRFGVKVADVRTSVFRGKFKRVRNALGMRASWKKAIVRLKPGNKIAEFEGN